MEDGPALPLPTLEPISRPSSTSTTASQAIAQLPGISSLATGSTTSSPQPRANTAPVLAPAASMVSSPHATVPTASGSLPTCQNCQTSTTPLWRRDEMGSVLCNACGLFLKLHGRPRPISLKTDVIKSRNRVKTMRPDMQMKKKQSLPATAGEVNSLHMQAHDNATAVALAAVRRTSQHKANGHGDDSNGSPVSRTGTPSIYDPHLPVFQSMDGHQYQSSSLPQYPSPGRAASPLNGESRLDISQTHEQIIADNATLKTRVSELDLINELYKGRLSQLENDQRTQDNFRHQAEEAMRAEANERGLREDFQRKHEETQRHLDDSHRRENILKRRLDEMEQELKEANDNIQKLEEAITDADDRPSKKPRINDVRAEVSDAVTTPKST